MTPKAAALAAYDKAALLDDGWKEAADLLAACLRSAPKTERLNLHAPVKIGRRAKYVGNFTIEWSDESQTFVSGAIWDKPQDRFAAAFQAADRLRRLRLSHGWEGEEGAPERWTRGPNGVRIESQAWWAFVRSRELPMPRTIRADNGEQMDIA